MCVCVCTCVCVVCVHVCVCVCTVCVVCVFVVCVCLCVCDSCNMGTRDIPDMHTDKSLRAGGIHIGKIPSAHVTANM